MKPNELKLDIGPFHLDMTNMPKRILVIISCGIFFTLCSICFYIIRLSFHQTSQSVKPKYSSKQLNNLLNPPKIITDFKHTLDWQKTIKIKPSFPYVYKPLEKILIYKTPYKLEYLTNTNGFNFTD